MVCPDWIEITFQKIRCGIHLWKSYAQKVFWDPVHPAGFISFDSAAAPKSAGRDGGK